MHERLAVHERDEQHEDLHRHHDAPAQFRGCVEEHTADNQNRGEQRRQSDTFYEKADHGLDPPHRNDAACTRPYSKQQK
jgi:hypothetical protein